MNQRCNEVSVAWLLTVSESVIKSAMGEMQIWRQIVWIRKRDKKNTEEQSDGSSRKSCVEVDEKTRLLHNCMASAVF